MKNKGYTNAQKGKRTVAGIIAAVMSLSIVLTGCSKNSAGNSANGKDSSSVSVSKSMKNYGAVITPEDIKKSFNSKSDTNQIMPLYNVAPDESFDLDFKVSEEDAFNVNPWDMVSVHTDIKCTEESKIPTTEDAGKDSKGNLRIKLSPITSTLPTDSEEDQMIEKGKETWGNATMYYIAIWYDTESDTLKKLDTPKIIPFTVKSEVAVPTLKREVDPSTGRFKLKWDKIEGAESYNIYTFGNDNTSTGSNNKPVSGADKAFNGSYLIKSYSTKDCEFDNFAGEGHGLAVHERSVSGEEYVLGQNYSVCGSYFVTAVVNGKESALSNIVNTSDLVIPFKPVDEDDIMMNRYDDESELPDTMRVLNIDGSVTKRKITYKFFWGTSYLTYEKDSGIDARIPEYQYTVEGTAITGFVTMDQKNRMEIYKDKKNGEAPTGKVQSEKENSSGEAEPENKSKHTPDSSVPTIINDDPENKKTDTPESAPDSSSKPDGENTGDSEKTLIEQQEENTKKHIENGNSQQVENSSDYEIFADSAEEEWIARNLASGNEKISLEAFPELQTYEKLQDVVQKVYYQNPYILGMVSYNYDYASLTLNVKYCYTAEEISEKQKKIKETADKIVKDNVKEKASEDEKCLQIYNYLNKNTKYDNDAVKEAEKTNFKKDENWKENEDSFNAYGIIVNKKGVCQSYAYSYKLLCSLCGVESKVVTGYLNETLPHAWNAVKLGDNWYQTDCTNNETNCGVPFFLYEADKETAKLTCYTEDKLYELDAVAGLYSTEKNDKEYYASNGMVASNMEEYKKILDKCIEKSGNVIAIRYTGEMNDDEFIKTVKEVYNMHGMEDKLDKRGSTYKNGFIILINSK